MGFISDNFTLVDPSQKPYTNYRAWAGYSMYLYHYIIRYNSTYEILTINPGGTTETGLEIIEHELYLGRFTTLSIGLKFAYKSGGGGNILRDDLYKVTGKKSECTIEKYKLNPATNDFDLYFTGIADFKTYKDDVDENGARFITINIIEQSDFQKLASRDELKLNLESTTSVGGSTITAITQTEVTCSPVNIYLYGRGKQYSHTSSTFFLSSSTYTVKVGSVDMDGLAEYTGGRIDFENPTDEKIYINSTDSAKTVSLIYDFSYTASIAHLFNDSGTTAKLYFNIYNSGGTLLSSNEIVSLFSNTAGTSNFSGSPSGTISGYSIPVDGYARFYLEFDCTIVTPSNRVDVEFNFLEGASSYSYTLIEQQPSFGSSTAIWYNVFQAFRHLMRLMMDRDDCFESDYLTDPTKIVNFEYLTSVRNLRKFPTDWAVLSFRDLFTHVRSIWGIALDYDNTTNRFKIVLDSDLYTTTARLDLGTITNCSFSTLKYPSKIKAGYDQDGDIEDLQGVQITHLKTDYSIDAPDDGTFDARGVFIMSAYQIEFLRRQYYTLYGLKDSKDDDKICYVHATGTPPTTVQATGLSGWIGIDEIYNEHATPRKNIVRNRILRSFFKYDSGGYVRFVSNKKNVNYSYFAGSTVYEQDSILESTLPTALYLPEQISGELSFTKTIKDAIDSNIYGVWTVTDEAGQEYEVHLTNVVFHDFLKTIKITAKLHNS